MHFTVVFHAHEAFDASYSLVFTPSPVWMQGDREVLKLNPENPHYKPGGVRLLLLDLESKQMRLADGPRACVVVVHQTGHGSKEDEDALLTDLEAEGFVMTICQMPG